MSASADGLTVGRLVAEYCVARDHPAPERVRWRLDELAAGPLAEALGVALDGLLEAGRDEVVVIRRLETVLELDVSRTSFLLSGRWADRVAASFARLLQEADDGNVLRFRDRASYRGRFLLDLASGRAWNRWCYRPFRGLKTLPISAALRTAILEEPLLGLDALRGLDARSGRTVVAGLGRSEARRVIEGWCVAGTGAPPGRPTAVALAVVLEGMGAEGMDSPWLRAFEAVTGAARVVDRESWPVLARLAKALAARSPLGREGKGEARTSSGRRSTPSGDAGAAFSGEGDPLRALPSRERDRLLRAWSAAGRPRVEPTSSARSAEPEIRETLFGGLVLLLPHLARLDLAAAVEGIDDPKPANAESALRLLLLAKCAGGRRAPAVLGDPAIRDLTGVPGLLAAGALLDWLRASGPGLAGGLTRILGAGLDRSEGLQLIPARFRDRRARVVAGLPNGSWLRVWSMPPVVPRADRRAGQDALRELRSSAGGGEALPVRVAPPSVGRDVSRQLDHLALPEALSVDLDLDLTLSAAAQSILRSFARRLPGFSASSPAYLYDSFLDVRMSLEPRAAGRICRLGRPPLAVILVLTGIARGALEVPWLGTLELFPE